VTDGSPAAVIAAARDLLASGRVSEARRVLEPAVERAPEDPQLRRLAGEAALRAAATRDAVMHLEVAAERLADDLDVAINLGAAWLELGEPARAIARLEPWLAVQPVRPLLLNLGRAFQDTHRLDEAQAMLRQILQRDPQDAEALTNLGTVLRDAGRLAEAIDCFESARRIAPSLQAARDNLAHAYLATGDYPRGFQAFEGRRIQDASGLSARLPRWDGRRRPGTLHVIAEQGFGDMLMFARFGAVLAQRGIAAVLHVHPRLVRLLKRSGGFHEVVPYGRAPLGVDACWAPLMSLPHVLGLTLDTVATSAPYLHADAPRVQRWADWLSRVHGMRVGVAWAGNPQSELDDLRGRSVPLAALAPLLRIPGLQWVLLQRQHGLDQIAQVADAAQIRHPEPDLDSGADGFVDTAAVMASLDLVVTCDTSIAHLAGGLGTPAWVALHHTPDWRWLRDRTDSPWYPTLRLFRQTVPGDWSGVVEAMAARLAFAAAQHAEGEFTPGAVLF